MLKRNGEICEHPAPGFPGLLTDSEQKAYTVALTSIEGLLQGFNEGAASLVEIEKQISQLASQTSEGATRGTLTTQSSGHVWQIHETLNKSARGESLLCSRQTEQGAQFGIIERFASLSAYAQANGDTDLLMTSNQPSVLLQDFVESERHVLQLVRKDIEATVEETLAEKFPGQDHSRVIKAISARCEKQMSPEGRRNAPAQKQTRNARIRF